MAATAEPVAPESASPVSASAPADESTLIRHESDLTKLQHRRELGAEAVWSLSTAKPGNGVEQIRDDNTDTYWQSDGGTPHLINIQFHRKVSLSEVCFYLDYQHDESYTPKKLSLRAGSTFHDLAEVHSVDLAEPQGWVTVPLFSVDAKGDQTTLRAFFLQICVVAMHQNGRDTHIRQIKVFGPRETTHTGSSFTTTEFTQFLVLR